MQKNHEIGDAFQELGEVTLAAMTIGFCTTMVGLRWVEEAMAG